MLDHQNVLFLVIGSIICITLCHWYIKECHTGACQTTHKRVPFYMLITLKHKRVVEKLGKQNVYDKKTLLYRMNICCRCSVELPL